MTGTQFVHRGTRCPPRCTNGAPDRATGPSRGPATSGRAHPRQDLLQQIVERHDAEQPIAVDDGRQLHTTAAHAREPRRRPRHPVRARVDRARSPRLASTRDRQRVAHVRNSRGGTCTDEDPEVRGCRRRRPGRRPLSRRSGPRWEHDRCGRCRRRSACRARSPERSERSTARPSVPRASRMRDELPDGVGILAAGRRLSTGSTPDARTRAVRDALIHSRKGRSGHVSARARMPVRLRRGLGCAMATTSAPSRR